MSESHYAAASRLIGEAQASPGPKGMFILAAAGAHGVLALADGITNLGKAAILLIEPANTDGHDQRLAALADSLSRNDAPEVDPAGNLARLEEEVNRERMERHEAEQDRTDDVKEQ